MGKIQTLLVGGFALIFGLVMSISSIRAFAMNISSSSSPNNNCSSANHTSDNNSYSDDNGNPVINGSGSGSSISANNNIGSYSQPYTGGASVVQAFYLRDGSTVTVTNTGAVIKQGMNGSPYREGWVNPANIGDNMSYSSVLCQLRSGSTNPFVNNSNTNIYSSNCSCTTGCGNDIDDICGNSSVSNAMPLYRNGMPGSATNTSVYTAASQPQPAAYNQSQPTVLNNTAYTRSALPNTGPGDVAVFGIAATILGTVGHYLFQRFRWGQLY